MTKVRRFEDLICWQKARELANKVYDLTNHEDFARDFRLRGQIQGAAGSAMHNIAEGHDAGTDTEFIRFLKMSRRSSSEVQSQLYLALDRRYISVEELNQTYALADEVKRVTNGLIAYLKRGGDDASSARQIREIPEQYLVNTSENENYQTNDNETSDHKTGDL